MNTIDQAELYRFHAFLLADRGRTESYEKAIAQVVRPGDVVLDVGTGTGILAFFACRAGARKVYAVEASPAIQLAQRVSERNGFQDRVVFLNDFSFNVSLPESVDVIVTETGETFGLQGGVLGSLLDAKRRFLREGGKVMPRSLELFIAPVEMAEAYHAVDTWTQGLYGFDFSPVRTLAANNAYPVKPKSPNLLGEPASLVRLSFSEMEGTYVKGVAICIASRAGVLHGLCGWAVTELIPGITFSNSPVTPNVEWAQSFLPLETPLALASGDTVSVTVTSNDGAVWRWQVEVDARLDAGKGRGTQTKKFDHSTFSGSPSLHAGLSRPASIYKPKLSRQGEAARFLLSTFNGRKTIEELEKELLRRYGDVFPSPATASRFLARMSRFADR